MTRRHPLLLTLLAVVALALLLPLPASAAKGGKGKKKTKKKADDLPTVMELREHYLEVTGESKMYEHDSWKMTGTFALPAQGLGGALAIWGAADRMYVAIEIPGLGLMEEGYDGTTGWSNDPMQGPRIKDEAETAATAFNADVTSTWPEKYEVMENLGAEEFQERPVWHLRLVPRGGLPERSLMIDRETGLELAMITTTPTAMGDITSTTVMSDWKTTDTGIMYPGTMVSEAMGMRQVMTLERVEFDPEGEPPFAPPTGVRALLEEGVPATAGEAPAEAPPEEAPADVPAAEPAPEGATK